MTNKPHIRDLSERRIEKIRNFINHSEQVDIFIFGHTNEASTWFADLFENEMKGKLRLVYNSGCTDGQEADGASLLKKAQAFVGHKGDNFGGKYTPAFIHYWFQKKPLRLAVELANQKLNKPKYFEDINDPYGYLYGDGSLQYSK